MKDFIPKEWSDEHGNYAELLDNGTLVTNNAEQGTKSIGPAMQRFLLKVLPEVLATGDQKPQNPLWMWEEKAAEAPKEEENKAHPGDDPDAGHGGYNWGALRR